MKKFTLMIVLIMAVFALTATAMAQTDYDSIDPAALDGVTVTFWHQHSGERIPALDQIIADFNETNEYGITVEHLEQGGYDEIFTKVTTNLASGTTDDLPSIVVAYANQAASYQVADALIDMNPLVDSPVWGLTEEDKADFFPGFYNADIFPLFDNARLGFPPNRSMEVMYYNASWLAEMAEAGAISFDGPPATPEQFKEAACAAVANPYSGATGEQDVVGYQLSHDASRLASWTFAFGGDIFDYEAGQYNFENEATVAAVSFLQELYDEGCATDVFERFGDQARFGAGTTLFTVGSSSGLPFYGSAVDDGAGFEWSVAPLPHVTEEPVLDLYGASVSIVKTTPEEELAAWLFIKYYTSPEAQAIWAEASNYFPVRASVAESMTDYFAANEAYATAFGFLQYGATEPPVPGYDPVRAEAEIVFSAITNRTSDATVEEQLAELDEYANEELELAMEGLGD